MTEFIDVFLHLDKHLNEWAGMLGPWLYVVLFLIVFCETGLVVTPFLPGDSLLFAVGALTSVPESPLDLSLMFVTLFIAAVLGDALNYTIGHHVGPRIFSSETSWLLNKEHLLKTQRFYEKYGGKTIILARFMPIVRTFAPFVAGIGTMNYPKFALFNIIGAFLWVASFLFGGYLFGGVPIVKDNFHTVIVAIVIISVLPPIIEVIRARREARQAAAVAK